MRPLPKGKIDLVGVSKDFVAGQKACDLTKTGIAKSSCHVVYWVETEVSLWHQQVSGAVSLTLMKCRSDDWRKVCILQQEATLYMFRVATDASLNLAGGHSNNYVPN